MRALKALDDYEQSGMETEGAGIKPKKKRAPSAHNQQISTLMKGGRTMKEAWAIIKKNKK